jgi:glycosyltransferase involved in cell wall biosynthesis
MAAELIKQLHDLGIKNHIGVFYDGERTNKEILNRTDAYVDNGIIFPCHGKIDMKTAGLVRKYIQGNAIDIIHSHKYKTNFYALLARFGTGCKLISTCHNWLGVSITMRFYAHLDKKILKKFDAVIGVSNEVFEELKKHIDSRKISKIDNGIDIAKYYRIKEKLVAKKNLHLEGRTVIGYVGRLSEQKGIIFLLSALRTLVDKYANISGLIVGDGDAEETLKRHACSLGISDRVIFAGKRDDTPLIYAAMDVFVLPSLKEAFPMVILEAMASCIPVVTTRVGDIPFIIQNGVSGILIEPKDPDAISRAVDALLSSQAKTDLIAKTAFENVQEQYSSLSMAKKYKAIYEKVLA